MQSLVSAAVHLNFSLVELFFRAFTPTLKLRYFYSRTQNIHGPHLASVCYVCLDAEQRRIYLLETLECLALRKSSGVQFQRLWPVESSTRFKWLHFLVHSQVCSDLSFCISLENGHMPWVGSQSLLVFCVFLFCFVFFSFFFFFTDSFSFLLLNW